MARNFAEGVPGWGRVVALSVIHGALVGGCLFLVGRFARGVNPELTRLLVILAVVISLVVLRLIEPHRRLAVVCAWMSPCVTWGMLLGSASTSGVPGGSWPVVAFLAGFHLLATVLTLAVMGVTLRVIGRTPRRDATVCAACGYSLVGLEGERCPECGAPVPSTASAYVAPPH